MVEPLLHFAVPFASLRAIGLDWRKVLFASLVALTPDADIFFQIHRSQSHSILVLMVVVVPLLILTRNRRPARDLVLLGSLGILTHLVLDLFQSPTPLFWPLLDQSLWLSTTLKLHIGSLPVVTCTIEQTAMDAFASFDEAILTSPGLGISLVLLAPSLIEMLRARRTSCRNSEQQEPSVDSSAG